MYDKQDFNVLIILNNLRFSLALRNLDDFVL